MTNIPLLNSLTMTQNAGAYTNPNSTRGGLFNMASPFISLNVNKSPIDEKVRLSKVWENFVSGNELDLKVRPLTHQSWLRSLEHGINPTRGLAPLTLTADQIKEFQSSNSLYPIIKPIFSGLKEVAIDSGHLVVFCNKNGEIIDLEGDSLLKSKAERMNFTVGTSWLENNIGTNAIGTAIATGSPMQIFASEHFSEPVHNWACSAAPVRDPATNEVIGVIDLTGEWKVIHPHSLSTAISIAQSIEGRLLHILELERYKLLDYYTEACIRNPSKVTAVLDRAGHVIKANELFYANGWIDSNSNRMIEIENVNLRDEHRWRSTKSEGWWLELIPFYYGNKQIGSVVQAISPKVSSKIAESNVKYSFLNLIGKSKDFKSVISQARSMADLHLPVLIEGESGTGKELFAQSIHAASPRSSGPFIAINCGAISKDLAESELFGYEEGTFTGAQKGGRAGKFQQAEGGTIFLDEIGEMPLNLQTILLRVLEEGEIVRLGGKKPIKLNVRVIAATNRDLKKESEEGKFRLDLYYRLNILSLNTPPLRDRSDDIPLLLEHLLNQVCRQMRRPNVRIDDEALQLIKQYEWPGNVRELRNFVYKVVVKIQENNVITITDLPKEMIESKNDKQRHNNYPNDNYAKYEQPLLTSQNVSKNNIQRLKDQELKTILKVLDDVNGNVQEAAKRLGIHRSTLYRKLPLLKNFKDNSFPS